MANKKAEHKVTEDSRYHNTWKLLKKYRDVVWSVEVSVLQLKNEFQLEYGSSIDDFLESVYLAGADLSGTDIEQHARSIERSNKMLTLINNSVSLLRAHHKSGEVYYWVLYYTFLSPQKLNNVEEILDQLRPHVQHISFRTYYRLRREAVETLSAVLWGYTAQETAGILKEFFPDE